MPLPNSIELAEIASRIYVKSPNFAERSTTSDLQRRINKALSQVAGPENKLIILDPDVIRSVAVIYPTFLEPYYLAESLGELPEEAALGRMIEIFTTDPVVKRIIEVRCAKETEREGFTKRTAVSLYAFFKIFMKEFGEKYTQEDLVSLGRYQVINKLAIDNIVTSPFPAYTLNLAKSTNSNREKVIRVSRERYAKKKN